MLKAQLKKALKFSSLEAYKKWNLLMDKQISTMKLQFNYQLKEFEIVDEVIAKAERPVILSNELPDAFPCKLLRREDGAWREHGLVDHGQPNRRKVLDDEALFLHHFF